MRPLRLVLLLTSFVAFPLLLTTFSVLCTQPTHRVKAVSTTSPPKSGVRALFSFHTPASLFPPSAVISLTDDNSTFFLARPANFGPYLPLDGLSGQLWVGSGFGEDGVGRGGAMTGAEGELGCSDVPGWGDGKKSVITDKVGDTITKGKAAIRVETKPIQSENIKGYESLSDGKDTHTLSQEGDAAPMAREDDGTDDHLHHPLVGSQVTKATKPGQSTEYDATHADIQSLQESAEIAGKVVLLSRGGCGFLEKAMWAQRRGGVALIVGDDTRGGPLVTMYGRGDTSNISIPSLFTSHTTAHLLSSLIPLSDDPTSGGGSKSGATDDRTKNDARRRKGGKRRKGVSAGPTFTPINVPTKPTGTPRPNVATTSTTRGSVTPGDSLKEAKAKQSWLQSLGSIVGIGESSSSLPANSRRPPRSGRINWIESDNWADEPPATQKKGASFRPKSSVKGKNPIKTATPDGSDDDFIIGVQDWRDKDLIGNQGAKEPLAIGQNQAKAPIKKVSTTSTALLGKQTGGMDQKDSKGFAGGSITPGSGEYETPGQTTDAARQGTSRERLQPDPDQDNSNNGDDENESWLTRLWASGSEEGSLELIQAHDVYRKKITPQFVEDLEFQEEDDSDSFDGHKGLWVTMTPTAMNTSPFFDTLLVLVVSPLVTLTVVYALLLLRSRIRRRRWRAPKSVVDRLPVRTYHTMAETPTATSSQIASPLGSNATSPLLHSSPKSYRERPRPRSRTTSGIAANVSTSLDKATQRISLARGEKIPKKRYNGRQIECVVCLEEYIDGQSRVMRLPCGHEFHAECITPWLTTRRRTCPICKGDVVRSLANGSTPTTPSSTQTSHVQYHDGNANSDEVQDQAAETTNESPSSAIPIPRSSDDGELDLERGDDIAATLVNDQPDAFSPRRSWRGLASLSLSAFSGEAAWRQAQADRNR
ncbi:hypothetical protein MMC13_003222 [Lambiella insularis]|nr:hypothetical protein [Lambiella insularis]